jgi:hypothetical protein
MHNSLEYIPHFSLITSKKPRKYNKRQKTKFCLCSLKAGTFLSLCGLPNTRNSKAGEKLTTATPLKWSCWLRINHSHFCPRAQQVRIHETFLARVHYTTKLQVFYPQDDGLPPLRNRTVLTATLQHTRCLPSWKLRQSNTFRPTFHRHNIKQVTERSLSTNCIFAGYLKVE